MTCIVGYVRDGVVYMGADSAMTSWMVHTSGTYKIIKKGDALIGVSGQPRVLNLLAHEFQWPTREEGEEDEAFMVSKVADKIKDAIWKSGAESPSVDTRIDCSMILVGYRGAVYTISPDYGVVRYADGYIAIGSGEELAMGALWAIDRDRMEPTDVVFTALGAAARFNPYVQEPFQIEVTGEV